MGSKSKSSSSTSSVINDSRIGATDQAVVNRDISGGNIDKSTSITTTDHGAIAAAQEIVSGAVKNAFNFGEHVSSDAFGFGEDTVEDAFDFGEDALTAIQNTVKESLGNVETANKSILDSTSNALATVERSTRSDSAVSLGELAKFTAIGVVGYAFAKNLK